MAVQAYSSLEPPVEYNQDHNTNTITTGIQSLEYIQAFDESRFVMTFLTILGVTKILCSYRLV